MADSISIIDFSDRKRAPGATQDSRPRWWLAANGGKGDEKNVGRESEIARDIESRVKFLREKQSYRIRNHIAYARLYGNATLMGVTGLSPSQMAEYGSNRERVSDSIIQSVVDTVVAQVGENKPRPYFLTSGGSYRQQRKAKRLNWFIDGIFYEAKAYELGGDSQRDGEIFGDGLIFIWDFFGRVKWTRTLSSEWWIDEVEGADGAPREAHWEHNWDREVLAAMFPKKRDEIMRADRANLVEYGSSGTQADLVQARFSWHLRSSPDAKDGKFTVSITSKGMGVLLTPIQDWEYDFFPIARFKSMSRPWGFWSQGVAERLQAKQIEMNVLLAAEQRSMKLAGTFKVFIEEGSKVVKEHVNNQVGALITYRGTKPFYETPPIIPPEYSAKKQELKEYCYESEGVSRMSAAGVKPAGLDSGEAQRVYRDTVQLRMKTRERNNERGYMDAAAISIAIAADIAKRNGGKYTVQAPHGRALREVTMTAKELEADDWSHQCFPTSSLPKDPAGRLQTIQEYVQAGFMTPRQARRALDFPDLEAVESLANAAEDLITMVLDDICDDGEKSFRPPEPTMDLQLAKEIVVEYINRGELQELEEDKLDLLRTWNEQLDFLTQAAQPPAPPPAPGGGGMGPPQANAAPPPVSNLVPNVPGQ